MTRAAFALALAVVTIPTAALADDPAARGWVFLADAQGSLAFADGYPNDVQKIGDPSYRVVSGAVGGGRGTFSVLASLHPRVAFGLWATYGAALSSTYLAKVGGGGVRVELLPFSEGWFAPVGFHGSFGVGTSSVERRDGAGTAANTTQSTILVGAFRDMPLATFEHSRLTWGPTAGYGIVFSRDFLHQSFDAGLRLTFVTTP